MSHRPIVMKHYLRDRKGVWKHVISVDGIPTKEVYEEPSGHKVTLELLDSEVSHYQQQLQLTNQVTRITLT